MIDDVFGLEDTRGPSGDLALQVLSSYDKTGKIYNSSEHSKMVSESVEVEESVIFSKSQKLSPENLTLTWKHDISHPL